MTFDLSVAEAARRIGRYNDDVHVFINVNEDAVGDIVERESTQPLFGVPFGLKDQFNTMCLPTTGGSWRFRDRRPAHDSNVYEAFANAGAILMGKSNLSDLGIPPEASNYIAGRCNNPFDPRRTAGGSSGGSAAGVAYGFTAFDWGTDIGGSIRVPAAFCGVLGIRLSSAVWPIVDLFPKVPPVLNWMCGQGPFARTTEELRLVLDVAAKTVRTGEEEPFELRGIQTFGPTRGRWATFHDDVRPHLEACELGEVRRATDLPRATQMRTVYAGVWASHFDDLLESEPDITLLQGASIVLSSVFLRGLFGDKRMYPNTAELLFLMALGRYSVFRNARRALANAYAVRDRFRALWDAGWLIAMPVTAYPPPRLGRANYTTHLLDYTFPGNLCDATSISIPFGTFDRHMPRSIQVMGPPGCEQLLLDVADAIIRSRDADPTLKSPEPWLRLHSDTPQSTP